MRGDDHKAVSFGSSQPTELSENAQNTDCLCCSHKNPKTKPPPPEGPAPLKTKFGYVLRFPRPILLQLGYAVSTDRVENRELGGEQVQIGRQSDHHPSACAHLVLQKDVRAVALADLGSTCHNPNTPLRICQEFLTVRCMNEIWTRVILYYKMNVP